MVVLASVCYGLFLLVTNVVPAFAVNAGIALLFCVFNTVPYSLIPIYAEKARTGFYVGIFNASSMVAQGLCNLMVSGLLVLVDQNVAWGIATGAVFGVAALGLVLFLPNTDAEKAALLRHQMEKSRLNFVASSGEESEGSHNEGSATNSENEAEPLVPPPDLRAHSPPSDFNEK